MTCHFNMQNDPTGNLAGRQLVKMLEERALLNEGLEAAASGWTAFMKWRNSLSAPDFERIEHHLDELATAATVADDV